jgi:hypothetical protein
MVNKWVGMSAILDDLGISDFAVASCLGYEPETVNRWRETQSAPELVIRVLRLALTDKTVLFRLHDHSTVKDELRRRKEELGIVDDEV